MAFQFYVLLKTSNMKLPVIKVTYISMWIDLVDMWISALTRPKNSLQDAQNI
jgi:hypothetical protein